MIGHWLMEDGGEVWHFVVDGVALCGALDDGVGAGSASAPDCAACAEARVGRHDS